MSLKIFWEKWKDFGRKIADFQAKILLTVFYFLILPPFGLVVRLFGDFLKIKTSSKVDFVDWTSRADSLEDVRRQF